MPLSSRVSLSSRARRKAEPKGMIEIMSIRKNPVRYAHAMRLWSRMSRPPFFGDSRIGLGKER